MEEKSATSTPCQAFSDPAANKAFALQTSKQQQSPLSQKIKNNNNKQNWTPAKW